jgi:hypothetical protein
MALTSTALAADLSASSLKIRVASATGFAVGRIIRIDNEFMEQTAAASGVVIPVKRGVMGSATLAHDTLADVTVGLPEDYPAVPPGNRLATEPSKFTMITVGENGTFAAPGGGDGLVVLKKATALGTTTLTDPTLAQDGTTLVVTNGTAAGHVITGTFRDGTTGAHTTATYEAFAGATMTLVAQDGGWNVVALNQVAIT